MEYFLDRASGVGMDEDVLKEYQYWSSIKFFNPSSYRNYSNSIDEKLNEARLFFLEYVGRDFEFIQFNSGSSESINNILLHDFLLGKFKLVIAPEHEHPVAEHLLNYLVTIGCEVIRLATDRYGRIVEGNLSGLKRTENARIYSSYINGYTGSEQNLNQLTKLKNYIPNSRLILDCTQVFGKLKNLKLDKVDQIFCSAHKFGGPKGFGIRFSRNTFNHLGDFQERPGTLNVPGIMSSKKALQNHLDKEANRDVHTLVNWQIPELKRIHQNYDLGLITLYGSQEMSPINLITKYPAIIFGFGTACSNGVQHLPLIYQRLIRELSLKSIIRVS